MSEIPPVYVEFKGDVSGLATAIATAQQQLGGFNQSVQESAQATHGLNVATVAFGGVLASVMNSSLQHIKQFGQEMVTDFLGAGSEVKSLGKYLDGTTESLSDIRNVAHRFGVDVNVVGASFRQLSRHLATNDKAAQSLGFSYKDANGNFLASKDILMKVADVYNSMSSKVERNAYVMSLFGRQGAALAPILARGSKGIEELAGESKKLGLQLSGDDLQSITNYNQAQAKLKETIESLKFAVGKTLLPILAKLSTIVTNIVIAISTWVQMHQELVKKLAAGISVITAITTAAQIFTAVQEVLATVMAALSSPIVLVVGGLLLLGYWFIKTYKSSEQFADKTRTAVKAVGDFIGKVLPYIITYMKGYLRVWLDVIEGIVKGAIAIDNVTGHHFERQLNSALTGLQNYRTKANDILDGVAKNAPEIGTRLANGIQSGIDSLANFNLQDAINQLTTGGTGMLAGQKAVGATSGKGGRGRRGKSARQTAYETAMKYIEGLQGMGATLGAQMELALSGATDPAIRLQIAQKYLKQVKDLVSLAQAEEVKTRNTKAHAAAVKALNSILREQAKIQKEIVKDTKAITDATNAANRALTNLYNTQTASNSWLAAQTRAAGPQAENFGGFIEVPVVIDGQTVFRATQKYSLLNNRRNISNGLATSGSLI